VKLSSDDIAKIEGPVIAMATSSGFLYMGSHCTISVCGGDVDLCQILCHLLTIHTSSYCFSMHEIQSCLVLHAFLQI